MGSEKKILIQGAMDIEVDYFLKNMEIQHEEIYRGFPFYEGMIKGHPAVLCKTGMGTIRAVLSTVAAFERYRPDFVLNQGTAGGHADFIHTGDLLFVDKAEYLNGLRMPYKKAGEGSDSLAWTFDEKIPAKKPDKALFQRLIRAAEALPYTGGKVYTGTVGTGDIFSKEADRIQWICSRKNNLAEDMETYAVFETCETYGVPAAGIRIISNHEVYREPFDEKQAENLQKYLLRILENTEVWDLGKE